jgi:putative transposase
VSRYIVEHRGRFGVEPTYRTLAVSASAYYERGSGRRSPRAVEDERLLGRIRELHAANYYAYGYRRVWKTLRRAGEQVPRCRLPGLMRSADIQGAKRRGRPRRTTTPDPFARRRPDLVQREFTAMCPNELGVADLSYCAAGKGSSSSRSSSALSAAGSSAGSSRCTCAPTSSSRGSRWRLASAAQALMSS